jgi:hypothetical protein
MEFLAIGTHWCTYTYVFYHFVGTNYYRIIALEFRSKKNIRIDFSVIGNALFKKPLYDNKNTNDFMFIKNENADSIITK